MPKLGMTHSVGDPGKYIVLTEPNNLRERERERERERVRERKRENTIMT